MFGGTRNPRSEDAPKIDFKELEREVDRLEKDMHELRATYEMFFMGVEKLEPKVTREKINSQLRRWQQEKVNNTAIRFKIQQLKARFVALENHWNRILRAREEGTYGRDLAKVKRRELEREAKEAAARKKDPATRNTAPTAPEGESLADEALGAGRTGVPAGQPGRPRQPSAGLPNSDMVRPSARSVEDLTEPKLRKLYQTYISARKRCNESVDLRYEEMAAALRKQVPKLMQTTGAKEVEFKVVIRSGKAVLKALPKT